MRQTQKLVVLVTVALLIIWPPPDCVQAAACDLDPTFGSGGKVMTDFFGFKDEGSAIVIQPDGKIVVGGTAFLNFIDTEFALARYNSNPRQGLICELFSVPPEVLCAALCGA